MKFTTFPGSILSYNRRTSKIRCPTISIVSGAWLYDLYTAAASGVCKTKEIINGIPCQQGFYQRLGTLSVLGLGSWLRQHYRTYILEISIQKITISEKYQVMFDKLKITINVHHIEVMQKEIFFKCALSILLIGKKK